MTVKTIRKLPKAPQPPLSFPGARADSDLPRRPRLVEPPDHDEKLKPGDRVEGLGNFGNPTGKSGTVERSNEEDALVKWDNDGRDRVAQPRLKRIYLQAVPAQ